MHVIHERSPARRCTECGQPQREERRALDYPVCGVGGVHLIGVPVWVCANQHEELEIPSISELHQTIAHLMTDRSSHPDRAEREFLRRRHEAGPEHLQPGAWAACRDDDRSGARYSVQYCR